MVSPFPRWSWLSHLGPYGTLLVSPLSPTFEPCDEALDARHEVEAKHEGDRDGDGRAVDAADVDLRTKRNNLRFGDVGVKLSSMVLLGYCHNEYFVQGDQAACSEPPIDIKTKVLF